MILLFFLSYKQNFELPYLQCNPYITLSLLVSEFKLLISNINSMLLSFIYSGTPQFFIISLLTKFITLLTIYNTIKY